MIEKDSYSGLSWITDEMKDEIRKRDKIVNEENMEVLFLLGDNSYFSIALHQILVNRFDKNPNSLNPIQLNLFLCMHLENAGQADSILSFLQEWFPEQKEQIIKSLNEIGATKSSEIIKQAVELLPKNLAKSNNIRQNINTTTHENVHHHKKQYSGQISSGNSSTCFIGLLQKI